MYKGLVSSMSQAVPKFASGRSKYGMKNKVHSVMISGMGAEEYYGPPRPGQSFAQYESFMSIPIAIGVSGVVIGALVAGPIGAIVGGIGGWLASPKEKVKSQTQGG